MQKRKGARLGQHFLKHGWAAAKLAHAVPLREGAEFLEIGPGKGVLTKELLKLGHVVAIEKDPMLVEKLRETFAQEIKTNNLNLIAGDVRDVLVSAEPLKMTPDARRGESGVRGVGNPTMSAMLRLRNNADGAVLSGGYIVAANIPYYITGEIIRQLLTTDKQPRAMALLVQKEVADRIVARDGKESILSLSVKAYGTARIIAKVSKSHFSPPPSVDSAILVIENISKRFFDTISETEFFALVHVGFASKRKMLAGNLSRTYDKKVVSAAFAQCGISKKARAEDIGLSEWKCLVATLHKH